MVCARCPASGPDTRTMPTPPRPWAVATAAMVSRAWFMAFTRCVADSKTPQSWGVCLMLGSFGESGVGRFRCRFDLARNVPLLGDRQAVVDYLVQHQTSREPQEEEGED